MRHDPPDHARETVAVVLLRRDVQPALRDPCAPGRIGVRAHGEIRSVAYDLVVVLVVVTGLPGAGKTTLGRSLATSLGLPFLDKDDILDDLLDLSRMPAERRSELSRQADVAFMERASLLPEAVLVSFWRRPELSTTSGTPTEWLAEWSEAIELWCRCEPAVAAHRFLTRRRHPGHGDDRRSRDDVRHQFELLDRLGPLGVGRLVSVDTMGEVVVDEVAVKVRDLDHDERRVP